MKQGILFLIFSAIMSGCLAIPINSTVTVNPSTTARVLTAN